MKIYRILIAIFAIIGSGIMGYLTYLHYANAQSFCDFSKEVSCDVVTTSLYSEIFGIPVSLMGIGFFAFILALILFDKRKEVCKTVLFLTVFMLIPSLYLTFIEAFEIGAFCVLCETSKGMMVLILIVSGIASRKFAPFPMRQVAPILIAGFLAVGITYFAQIGGGTQKDYSELFACLNENGVTYYKSVRCSSCRRQEKLMGSAYPKLNAIECHPDGIDPQPELCLAKNISKTPMFILEQNGIEIKRAIGIQQIEELAAFGNCSITK